VKNIKNGKKNYNPPNKNFKKIRLKPGPKPLRERLKNLFFLKINKKIKKISIQQNEDYYNIKLFNEDQVERYGFYRESDLKKEKVKKILVSVNPFLKNILSKDPLFTSIRAIAKSFIGNLIEISKQIMFELADTLDWMGEPIQPLHLIIGLKRYLYINNNR